MPNYIDVEKFHGPGGVPITWYDLNLDTASADFTIANGFRAIVKAATEVIYVDKAGVVHTDTFAANSWIGPDGGYPGGYIQTIRNTSTAREYVIVRY